MEEWTKQLYCDLARGDIDKVEYDSDKEKGVMILFDMLQGEYKQLIFEKYRDQKSLRDIADAYGCSYQNIGSKIKRLLERMRNCWCGKLINGFEVFISACPVESAPISKRTWGPLRRNGIDTLEDMRFIGRDEVSKIRFLGEEGMREIDAVLGWVFGESTKSKIINALKTRNWKEKDISAFLREVGLE